MKQFLKNIKKIFVSKVGIISFIIGVLIIAIPTYFFVEASTIRLGYGDTYYLITEVYMGGSITLLFGLFLGATIYKMKYFGGNKKSKLGFIGGVLGVMAGGCPACSVTLVSYIGLASLVSLLPYHGLELKIISIIFLLFANYFTIRDLEVCKIKKKKTISQK